MFNFQEQVRNFIASFSRPQDGHVDVSDNDKPEKGGINPSIRVLEREAHTSYTSNERQQNQTASLCRTRENQPMTKN